MLVLGIDPGSRTAGWGIIESKGNKLKTIAFGTVTPPLSKELPPRLTFIYKAFGEIIKEYSPSEVSVENVFFAKNPQSALILGQARSASILPALNAGLPLYEYSALQVKKAVTGKGRADKKVVADMVCRFLSLREKPKPHDVTDALAIALCHIHSVPVLKMIQKKTMAK